MKKLLILLLSIISLNVYTSLAESSEPDTPKQETVIQKKETQHPETVDQSKFCDSCYTAHKTCFNCNRNWKSKGLEYWIVLSPTILFIIFLYLLKRHLSLTGFKLTDALTENIPVELIKPNPNPELALTNPTISTKELRKSTSRLIVFITGFTSVSIGVCFTSYYMYIFFATGCAPNLENITNILLSLGIGVIPYAFNKVSTALTLK